MNDSGKTTDNQLDHSSHQFREQKYSLCFLAHDINITLNVGSLFRLADALGVEKIYLTGNSITPPNDKIKRTSRSTEKQVPFEYSKNPLTVVDQLKQDGYKIISLEITSNSIELNRLVIEKDEKICLMIGSENEGVDAALLAASDVTVHIPMLGRNSSMNVANACAIATYTLTQQLSLKKT